MKPHGDTSCDFCYHEGYLHTVDFGWYGTALVCEGCREAADHLLDYIALFAHQTWGCKLGNIMADIRENISERGHWARPRGGRL